ncbi:50S ribosomal protein L23 [Candidatus Woesearchaeota archaeon]|jgi:large subunit ribosomal protein L23|nr:50S ribosomal protein L23 [Candidatus Woesearchaeota archaeon]
MEAYTILKHPLSTEKAIRMMEAENKLVFMVERKATKILLLKAFEQMFKIKPIKVNTLITPKGKKKAIFRLPLDQPAIDIATQLGIM